MSAIQIVTVVESPGTMAVQLPHPWATISPLGRFGRVEKWSRIWRAVCGFPHQPHGMVIPAARSKSNRRLQFQLLLWAGTNLQFEEPFFDIRADDISVILLQVVQARAELHQSAVLKLLRRVLGEIG